MKPNIRAKMSTTTVTPRPRGESSSHIGASITNRDVTAWQPPRRSPDADLLPDLDMLRGRSRDMDRNSGIAKGGIQTLVDNVVGTGLRLSARPNWRALGKDRAWALDWGRRYEAIFCEWWWSTACHAGDTMTGDQMTAQVFRSGILNGEWLALPLWLPNRGDGYSTKIQTVEPDRLSNPNGMFDRQDLRAGIEIDPLGMPTKYWIRKTHPGDFLVNGNMTDWGNWEGIPRKTSFGRMRVLHGFDQERPGQSRGKPLLSSVLSHFKQIDRYANAEISRAVAQAMVAGLIYTDLDQDAIVELFKNDSKAYMAAREENAVRLESGSLLPLFPGDKVEPFIPSSPNTQYGVFMTNVLRIIAVALDMPYELLMKDFSQTSYNSARASMLEAWRSFNRRRDWLGTQWMDPINLLLLEEVVNDGRIEAPDFYKYPKAYAKARWLGPGRGWVDPTKEAQAVAFRLASNVTTLEDECAEQGKDWLEVLEQRGLEIAEMTRLNIPLPVAPNASPAGASGAGPSSGPEPGGAGPGEGPDDTPNRADKPNAPKKPAAEYA